jgi:hypothetical protein
MRQLYLLSKRLTSQLQLWFWAIKKTENGLPKNGRKLRKFD